MIKVLVCFEHHLHMCKPRNANIILELDDFNELSSECISEIRHALTIRRYENVVIINIIKLD